MSITKEAFDGLIISVKEIANGSMKTDDKLVEITSVLKNSIHHYDWVGFYFVDPCKKYELMLGQFTGEDTEHCRIPFGRGICGQVAESQKTMIVQNVTSEDNYLSCNPHVRSEIVLPIFVDGTFIGELDIDSHTPAPFTALDECFLEQVCEIVSDIIKTDG